MERIVISKSAKRRAIPKGSAMYHYTEQVVYKQEIGKRKGKPIFDSQTRHEIVRN